MQDKKERRDLLISERKRRNLSQEQVSDKLEISRSHYSNIENNIRIPSLTLALKISDFFGIDLKKLVK